MKAKPTNLLACLLCAQLGLPTRALANGAPEISPWRLSFNFGYWRLARRLRSYRRTGRHIPKELLLRAPNGKLYINRSMSERVLKDAGF